MKEEKTVTLDLTGCKYYGEVHKRIRKAFDFPEWYGENWSAFWDLLNSEFDSDRIVVIGLKTLPKEFSKQMEIMQEILQELKDDRAKYGEQIEIEIRN